MQNIYALAEKIQQKVDGTTPTANYDPTYDEYEEVLVDPASIALMSTIILNLIKLIQGCRNSSNQATTVAHSPNYFQRLALKRELRREIGAGTQYEALRNKYYNEIRNQGAQITESEMEGLYNDHNAYTTMEYRVDDSRDFT